MQQRLKHVTYEEAGPELREIYDDTMKVMGLPFVIRWFQVQGSNVELLRGNWAKVKGALFEGDIPMLLKQLIIYQVSRTRGCNYCAFIHGLTADMLGSELCSDDGFKVSENLDSTYIPTSYKTAIRIVSRCALDPASASDEDFEDLRDEGFSEAEIQELLAQADIANMLNTIADTSGIEIDPELLGMASGN